MVYNLFLYKAKYRIEEINRAIRSFSKREWQGDYIADLLLPFDAEKVKYLIEKQAVSENGKVLCNPKILHGPDGKGTYLQVSTSYEHVKKVIIVLHGLATEYGLVLYDMETGRAFEADSLYDEGIVMLKRRAQAFNQNILKSMKAVYRVRKLTAYREWEGHCAHYVVTLRKKGNVPLEERVKEFQRLLCDAALENEKIFCEHQCFVVKSELYRITYTLEAYLKCADRICYMEEGIVKTELMRRMSCETAWLWAKNNLHSKFELDYAMQLREMKSAYLNPAERFVRSIIICKQEDKEKFCVRYHKYIGGAIAFRANATYTAKKEEVSSFMIDDMDVGLLIDVINRFYPYTGERWYARNLIPMEMWWEILREMKRIRNLILNDTFCDELKPYLTFGNLYPITEGDEERDSLQQNPVQFAYENRYDVVRIYDMFIAWSKKQLEMYSHEDDLMLYFEGP